MGFPRQGQAAGRPGATEAGRGPEGLQQDADLAGPEAERPGDAVRQARPPGAAARSGRGPRRPAGAAAAPAPRRCPRAPRSDPLAQPAAPASGDPLAQPAAPPRAAASRLRPSPSPPRRLPPRLRLRAEPVAAAPPPAAPPAPAEPAAAAPPPAGRRSVGSDPRGAAEAAAPAAAAPPPQAEAAARARARAALPAASSRTHAHEDGPPKMTSGDPLRASDLSRQPRAPSRRRRAWAPRRSAVRRPPRGTDPTPLGDTPS